MKVKESNLSIFGEVLEFMDTNQIEQIINKISKTPFLGGLTEEDEIKYEQQDLNSSANMSFHSSQIKNAKFPYYDGSFKKDISKFLKSDQNRDLNHLYELLIKEIQKIYHAYTHVESKLYIKINQYIQFSDAKNTTPMEIISKIKEISETLLDTIKYIESYLFKNFQILQQLFFKIDQRLSSIYDVESISLFFLLDIFDLPNNELSYMLMFKIIDEETCILKYLIDILDNQIKNLEPKNNRNIEINDPNPMDNEACLLDNKTTLSTAAYTAMINIKDKFIIKINESINAIDNYSYFRAKFYNKYIYTKGNYAVDTNLFLNYLNEDNDDNNEEFLPINSVMDEEIVISKFIKKSIFNKFLNFFYSQLPAPFKRNEKLIMLHCIQYNIISVFIIYWYRNIKDGFLDISLFYLGRMLSKMLFNSFIKKRTKIKKLLLFSNILLIGSLIAELIFMKKSYYKWVFFCSRFLIGISYSKNIETKFILNYIPKLLVKKTIKKYFCIGLLSLGFGFFLTSGFNHIFSFVEDNNKDFEDKLKKNDLDANNIGEIIVIFISFIILVINCILFKDPKLYDLMKTHEGKSLKRSSNKSLIQENEISNNIQENKEKEKEKPEDKKDATSIFSYGKAKLISFKEKNKAKLLEESLKLDIWQKNYEGTNQIFNILQKLIINENLSSKSYTNKATKGYLLLFSFLYIISTIIIFYNPLVNSSDDKEEHTNIIDSRDKIWIFGCSYLLTLIIYRYNVIKISSDNFIWNIIILVFIFFEIGLSVVFIIFDKLFFKKSPIEFDNYYFYGFLALILFFNNLIEICCLKVMIREIPIEKKISSINIDNFLDVYECLIKGLSFAGLYLLNFYSLIQDIIYIKVSITIFYIFACISFIGYNFKRKQNSLTRIINKVTYESF